MRSAAVVACASLLSLAVAGCNPGKTIPKEAVLGSWDWKINGRTLVVTLDKDGTGSLGGKVVTWRIQRGNNFVYTDARKDFGFLIDSADENTIRGTDPQAPGTPIVWTRRQ